MRTFAGVTGLAAVALAALAGCRSPTQISVEVSTNVACSAWQGTAIAVGELGPQLETKPATTTSTFCDDAGYLGTVVAIPSGAENGSVAFRVVGAVGQSLEECTLDAGGTGCVVARRALNFIPHTPLTLSVPLLAACEGILCDPSTTCVDGACRPATIPDPSQCANATCGEGALPAADGGAADATAGGAGDAGSEGGLADATVGDGGASDGAAVDGGPGPALDASSAGCGASCSLAVGETFTCALRAGNVTCWGENYLGEIGGGAEGNTGVLPTPVKVSAGTPLSGVQGIVAGYDTSCAFLSGGAVSCWGGGAPLAIPGDDDYATVQPRIAGASAVSIADYHMCWQQGAALSCGVYDGKEQAAFGDVATGGDDGGAVVAVSPPDASPGPFVQLDTAQFFTCVLDVTGSVYCIGDNSSNETDPFPGLGFERDDSSSFVKVVVPGGAPVQELGLMQETACARSGGRVFCWGNGYYGGAGGLPDGGYGAVNEIVYPDGGPVTDAVLLAPGENHVCALLASAQVACWGDNSYYELGRGELVAQGGQQSAQAGLVVLADGGAFTGVGYVASGGAHSCATTNDGKLWCWGDNRSGETAPGDGTARSSPSLVTY